MAKQIIVNAFFRFFIFYRSNFLGFLGDLSPNGGENDRIRDGINVFSTNIFFNFPESNNCLPLFLPITKARFFPSFLGSFSTVLAVDGLLGFAEESADEADVGGLHLGAGGEIGESLPEGLALFWVFEKANLLKDGEEVGFEVFELLGGGEIFVGRWVLDGF